MNKKTSTLLHLESASLYEIRCVGAVGGFSFWACGVDIHTLYSKCRPNRQRNLASLPNQALLGTHVILCRKRQMWRCIAQETRRRRGDSLFLNTEQYNSYSSKSLRRYLHCSGSSVMDPAEAAVSLTIGTRISR